MNKAFVREPDDSGDRKCPRCGSLGICVGPETLQAQLALESLFLVSKSAYFCPRGQCPVAYFDQFERTVDIEQLKCPVWPKDPEAPICACFGLTRDDIEADIAAGTVERTRAAIARAKSPEARCMERSPTGRSCVAEVQRYYMKLRGAV